MKRKIFHSLRLIAMAVAALTLCAALAGCGIKTNKNGSLDLLHADLTPYVTLGQYKDLMVDLSISRVSDAEVESAYRDFTDSLASYEDYTADGKEPVNRATVENDYLEVSFTGFLDGKEFEDGTAEGQKVLLAEDNGYISWFVKDLYGILPGTTVETTGTIPDDKDHYGDFAGAEVTYRITLDAILGHYTFPKVTDELVKEKTGCDTVEAYREYLYTAIEASKKAALADKIYEKVHEMAIENATFPKLPKKQVTYYYNLYYGTYVRYAVENDCKVDDLLKQAGMTREEFHSMAEESTKEDLVFYAIVQAEGIEITDEEYAEGAARYASEQKMTVEELEEQYGKDYIVDCLLFDETLYFLAENATVNYTYTD